MNPHQIVVGKVQSKGPLLCDGHEPGDIVLDPFGGGSSFEAAQGLKRYWIGSEITDCQPIVKRLIAGRHHRELSARKPSRWPGRWWPGGGEVNCRKAR
jgi:hypothetical protein